MNSLMQLRW